MYGKLIYRVKHAKVLAVGYCEHKQKKYTLIDQFSVLRCENIHNCAPRFLICTSTSPFVQGACGTRGECLTLHGMLQFAISLLRYSVPLSVIRYWGGQNFDIQ